MKTDHNLIDRDYPVCLYCGEQCNIALEGNQVPLASSTATYDIETLTCQSCGEHFSIDQIQDVQGETTYVGFSFTCHQYEIVFLYKDEVFTLYTTSGGKFVANLPIFEVDFSDKNKLHDKLRTYIVFS